MSKHIYDEIASTHSLRLWRNLCYWQRGGYASPLIPTIAPAPGALSMPSKPKSPPRKIYKAVRFAETEWDEVKAKLEGREFGSTARAIFLGKTIPERRTKRPQVEIERRQMSAFEAEKIRQLAAFGSNLNQIARVANEAAKGGQQIEILGALVGLERAIAAVADNAI